MIAQADYICQLKHNNIMISEQVLNDKVPSPPPPPPPANDTTHSPHTGGWDVSIQGTHQATRYQVVG